MACKETQFGGLRLERVRASNSMTVRRSAIRRAGRGAQGQPLPVIGEFFFGAASACRPGRCRLTVRTRPGRKQSPRPARDMARALDGALEMDGLRVLTDPVFGERASRCLRWTAALSSGARDAG